MISPENVVIVKVNSPKATSKTLRAIVKAVDTRADINECSTKDGKLYQYVNGAYKGHLRTARKCMLYLMQENAAIGITIVLECCGGFYHWYDDRWNYHYSA